MNEDIIKKLIKSTNNEDILLALEYSSVFFSSEWFDSTFLTYVLGDTIGMNLNTNFEKESSNDIIIIWDKKHYCITGINLWRGLSSNLQILRSDKIINLDERDCK